MSDEDLDLAFGDLPREQAGPGFTGQVMARLDGGPKSSRPSWRLRWATAGVLGLLATGLAIGLAHALRREAELARRQQLQEISSARMDLAAELARIKAQVVEAQPVLLLDGRDDVGFLLPDPGGREHPDADLGSLRPRPVRLMPAAQEVF